MRIRHLIFVVAAVCGGCATAAETERDRMVSEFKKVDAVAGPCFDAAHQTPAAVALEDKLPPRGPASSSLALLANASKPTTEQVQYLLAYHAAQQPCRKLVLENVGKVHPALVGMAADSYAAQDERYLKLIKREATWGENARGAEEERRKNYAKLEAWFTQLQQQLANAHAYEMQQRQRAAQALMIWGMYQQQLELQRQAIANANRPAVTNCNYYGRQIQCTTY